MAVLVVPVLVAVLGALVYALSSGKASELGRIAFAFGLMWAVYLASHTIVRLP